jgi:hypothetical protein
LFQAVFIVSKKPEKENTPPEVSVVLNAGVFAFKYTGFREKEED